MKKIAKPFTGRIAGTKVLISLFFILLPLSIGQAQEHRFIRRPPPHDPVLLSKTIYTKIKEDLPAPPLLGSPSQSRDEDILRRAQKTRTEEDCKRALDEVDVSVESLFAKRGGCLNGEEAERVKPLLNLVGGDSYYFSEKLKMDFPRKRPFEYLEGIHPCVPKEVTASYPSGHALLSRLQALILSDLMPNRRERCLARANEIAADRVLGGVHHTSDIEAGQKVADMLYERLKKSEKYREEFERVSRELMYL